jgi:hypothetical protein
MGIEFTRGRMMVDPIAFVVMPFDKKKTDRTDEGVPAEIDFDALWGRVYEPVLREIGYKPVRADWDVGALIIVEMIQRLALADLVLADVSLPNANVYYEVGVRHAAQEVGCVLVAADWAKPVFDLEQMRQLRFPLADGNIPQTTAEVARRVLAPGLETLIDGSSPVFDAVPGFPDNVDPARLTAFRDVVADLFDFDAEVKATRMAPSGQRRARALEVFERHRHNKVIREAVVLQLIRLLRDLVGMKEVLEYIASLPKHVARHPLVVEQRCLALSKAGDPIAAAAQLDQLIKSEGRTSERIGLLGGRYKALSRDESLSTADRRRYLDRAIESYQQGMILDLNNYYPASNLARLYRRRNDEGDEERASEAHLATVLACRRAIELGTKDEWVRPTLLGAAFDEGNVPEARRLVKEVQREGAHVWQIDTTMRDLRETASKQPEDDVRAQLEEVLTELDELQRTSDGILREG